VYTGAMTSVGYDSALDDREVKRLLPAGLTAAHD
jgi:hypothetical protein